MSRNLSIAALALITAAPLAAQEPAVPQYSIQQFMATVSLPGLAFSPDEKHLLLVRNYGAIPQLVEIPVAGGTSRQLTKFTTNGNLVPVGYHPADGRVLYLRDNGGDENTHLFVREREGAERDLTPIDNTRAELVAWLPDDRSFMIRWNSRDRRFMDLYEVDVATLKPRLLWKDSVGYRVGAVSPDRTRAVLERIHTQSETELHIVDLKTGAITPLTPHESDALRSAAGFSPDGRWLYYVTNEGAEFSRLVRHDLTTNRVEEIESPKWDVIDAAFSKRHRYMAVSVNVDARRELRLYENAPGRRVRLQGFATAGILNFVMSPSERYAAFYLNSDHVPRELYVMAMDDRKPRRLTNTLDPAIDARYLVEGKSIRYRSWDGVEIPGILYTPVGAKRGDRLPVVLEIHGGPGLQSRFGYEPFIQYLVNHGYVVVRVNNRGSSGYGRKFLAADDRKHGEADLDDIVWSKRWLATLGYADTSRVAIHGRSYGGFLVLAGLAFRPKEFAAGVNFYGVSNWIRTLAGAPPGRGQESIRKALYVELGDPVVDSVRLHAISPLFHASKIERPLLVIQGERDPRVLKRESDEIVEAVRGNGGVVEYIVFPDEGHGLRNTANAITAYQRALEFLDRHVKRSAH